MGKKGTVKLFEKFVPKKKKKTVRIRKKHFTLKF